MMKRRGFSSIADRVELKYWYPIGSSNPQGESLPYCPSCGKETRGDMVFCPNCGAALSRPQAPRPPRAPVYRDEKSEKSEKSEKQEKTEKSEKTEKGEFPKVWVLAIGLFIIFLGLTSLLSSLGYIRSAMAWAWFLLILGVVFIIASIYAVTSAKKRNPRV